MFLTFLRKILNETRRIKNKIRYKNFKHIGCNFFTQRGFQYVGEKYISIGDYFNAGEGLMLQAWDQYRDFQDKFSPNLIIGNNVSMMSRCHLSCAQKIEIGDGTLFGDNVFVTDNFHGTGAEEERYIPPIERPLYVKGEVIIGKNVWIGRNVCIMPNVHIGDCATVGANSVVTK